MLLTDLLMLLCTPNWAKKKSWKVSGSIFTWVVNGCLRCNLCLIVPAKILEQCLLLKTAFSLHVYNCVLCQRNKCSSWNSMPFVIIVSWRQVLMGIEVTRPSKCTKPSDFFSPIFFIMEMAHNLAPRKIVKKKNMILRHLKSIKTQLHIQSDRRIGRWQHMPI